MLTIIIVLGAIIYFVGAMAIVIKLEDCNRIKIGHKCKLFNYMFAVLILPLILIGLCLYTAGAWVCDKIFK